MDQNEHLALGSMNVQISGIITYNFFLNLVKDKVPNGAPEQLGIEWCSVAGMCWKYLESLESLQ